MPLRRHGNLVSVLCAAICGLAGCAYGTGANATDDEIDGGSGEPIPHADGYRKTSGYLSNAALPDSSSHSPSLRQAARLQTGRAADKPPPSTVYEILYNGQYPSRRESGYSERLQGIASTNSHWYFMQELRVWKFPMSHDLNRRVTEPNPEEGILRSFKLGESGTPSLLLSNGYNHFGDGDVHDGKLYVPVESDSDAPPVLAVFDAGTLAYLDGVLLPLQNRAGWCAVEPVTGRLYTSNSHVDAGDPIFIYDIRWQGNNLSLVPAGTLGLRKPDGSRQDIAGYMQGGDFSDDGSTLFLANGKAYNFDENDGGLWAFDTTSGKRLHRSSQTGDFKYEFHPGIKFEEPEGLTFQPISAIRSPGIPHSDLHAILLDNDFAKGREDSFWLKHYMVHDDDGIQLSPADLVAKSVTLTIGTPASTAMDAHIRVVNEGSLNSSAFTAQLYLSQSSTSWSNPVRVYDGSGPTIKGGESYEAKSTLNVAGVPAGTYYLHVVLDESSAGAIDNNHAVSNGVFKPFTDLDGPPADLAIDYVAVPKGPFGGHQTLPVAFSVTNHGTSSGPWSASFWAIRSPDLSGEMVFLGHGSSGPLGSDKSVKRVEQLSLTELASGNWYVLMQLFPEAADGLVANNLKVSATPFEKERSLSR